MNPQDDNKELFLSWQGQVTGPHGLSDVRNLLKLGKIHSLYKVQVEGQWILLRDYLAILDRQNRAESARQQAATPGNFRPYQEILQPVLVPEDEGPVDDFDDQQIEPVENSDPSISVPTGLAVASFVLSLFFFVPFLNGITWLLALIFGHLALSNTTGRPVGKAATLAWVALWISYVEIGYFLIGLAWAAVTEMMPMVPLYFLLHGQMLGNAIGALIGAGVLMLAIKLASGHLIRFTICYLGALLPSAVSSLAAIFLEARLVDSPITSGRTLLLFGLLHLALFIGQIFFWVRFILLPNGEQLGLSRATLASLLYTFVFIFVVFGYVAVLAALTS